MLCSLLKTPYCVYLAMFSMGGTRMSGFLITSVSLRQSKNGRINTFQDLLIGT